jgi:hypothetical protein
MSIKVCRLIIILSVFTLGSSWGFLVHRTIHQLAIYQLPPAMRPFFYSNMDYLVINSVRPDLRRNEDSAEAAKHFIDFEAFGDSAAWKMPLNWNEAVSIYTKDSLLKYGYVPYHIIFMKEKLTYAFKSGNKDSILFYAADIGHYIGDANVPLHTTLNYDGQLTNQKGLHSLWESLIPDLELEQYRLYNGKKAKYLSDPAATLWQAVRRAHVLVKNVLEMETETSKEFTDSSKFRIQLRNNREVKTYTREFAKAYSKRMGKMVNDQLLISAELIADFWYTAWMDAGRPDLSMVAENAVSKQEKTKLKQELKAYRKNRLGEMKLLLSRQISSSSPQQ